MSAHSDHGHSGHASTTTSGKSDWITILVSFISFILILGLTLFFLRGCSERGKNEETSVQKSKAEESRTETPITNSSGEYTIYALTAPVTRGNYALAVDGETEFNPHGINYLINYSDTKLTFVQNGIEYPFKGNDFTDKKPDFTQTMKIKGSGTLHFSVSKSAIDQN